MLLCSYYHSAPFQAMGTLLIGKLNKAEVLNIIRPYSVNSFDLGETTIKSLGSSYLYVLSEPQVPYRSGDPLLFSRILT